MALRVVLAVAVLAVTLGAVSALYLPGVAPIDYEEEAEVSVKVRQLTSNIGLAYDYYDLKFCKPDQVEEVSENLGEYLQGTTIESSPYDLLVLKNQTCQVVCKQDYNNEHVAAFSEKIDELYRVHWILDNLPAAYGTPDLAAYADGFPLGGYAALENDPNKPDMESRFLLNHHHMIIQYHQTEDGNRIVGFYVQPVSVRHTVEGAWNDEHPPVLTSCPEETGLVSSSNPMLITGPNSPKKVSVIWSYDVSWVPSDVRWASRWDVYLSMGDIFSDEIHWFAIANSFIIVLFLTGMVAMILVRALYKDLSRYNRVATDEEKADDREETGWKLVHADVFRPPTSNPMRFCVVMGFSSQVFGMAVVTIVFAAIGFLSPANRGALMIAMFLLFQGMGICAGYVAARIHKTFNGKQWQRVTLKTAFVFPATFYAIVFLLNLFVWAEGSSQAIPFGDMVLVLFIWFLIAVPLVFIGAYYGFKRPKYEYPVAIGSVPRPVPAQQWYLKLPFTMLVGGVLPFGAVFVEVFFILSSLWLSVYYYVFGFLLLAFLILVFTCCEIAIVLTYFQLCAEDYRWWWRSYMVPASAGLYLFVYSIFYYATHLSMTWVAALLYFGYMSIISTFFGMMCGVVGHYACFWFTRKIYSAVKVD